MFLLHTNSRFPLKSVCMGVSNLGSDDQDELLLLLLFLAPFLCTALALLMDGAGVAVPPL